MKPLSLFLVICIAFPVLAQEDEESSSSPEMSEKSRSSFVSLGLGTGLPLGDFKSTDFSSQTSGYAKPGYLVELAVGTQTWGPVGLMLSAAYMNHGVDHEALISGVTEVNPGFTWTMTMDNWESYAIQGGIYVEYPVGTSGFSMTAKVLAGFLYATYPGFTFTGDSTSGSRVNVEATSMGTGSVCYSLGLGARYDLNDKLFAHLMVDGFKGTPQFKYAPQQNYVASDGSRDYSYSNVSTGIAMDQLRVQVGVGYRF